MKSPNHGGPITAHKFVVMHYTAGGSFDSSVAWLCNPSAKASAHYVVGRAGELAQLVDDNVVAWHAGESQWKDLTGLNKYSIGVELCNAGPVHKSSDGHYRSAAGVTVDKTFTAADGSLWEAYPEQQIDAAVKLVSALVERLHIPTILTHELIAPGRKLDTGPAFPLQEFRARCKRP
jgi:N-acetylmuramoyl-L-alanine amidase